MTRYLTLLTLALTVIHGRPASGQAPLVHHVAVDGAVDFRLTRVVERALESAARDRGDAVILELGSPGGRVDVVQAVIELIEGSDVPVYALVSSEAWGATALLALAGDSVFMAPASSLGAGTGSPMLDELSRPAQGAIRDAFRALVARRGLDPLLGAAMVDQDVAIRDVVDSGELLTLGAEAAVRLGLAAAQVSNLDDLLSRLGLDGGEIVAVGPEWTGTSVHVANYNLMDVRIFLLRGGTPYRLGNVTSMGSAEFDVPAAFLPQGARIRVVAELIGSSERTTTEEIRVEPGLMIQWVIENRLSQSSLFYFVR